MSSSKRRILAIDTSSSPGYAVIEIDTKNKPKLIYADAVKTDSKLTDAERYDVVRSKTALVCFEYGPFERVVREHFIKGGSKRGTQLVFGAWSSVDSALKTWGYVINVDDEITPTTVKKVVAGSGKAQKDEVEAGVRRLLALDDDFKFNNNSGGDASDAAAIGLAWLSEKGGVTL